MRKEAIQFTFPNIKKLDRMLAKLGEDGLKQAASALFVTGEKIMTESKTKYCPVDTGNLRATGHVKPPVISNKEIVVELGYGSSSVGYAVFVHEVDRNYKVGEWKYLETPMKAAVGDIAKNVAAAVEKLYRSLK